MGRQRELLSAIASQVEGSDILSRFPNLTEIMRWTVRTSLSAGEFSSLVDRLRSGASVKESIGLTPPLINPGNPNFTDITNLIDALQASIRDDVDFLTPDSRTNDVVTHRERNRYLRWIKRDELQRSRQTIGRS